MKPIAKYQPLPLIACPHCKHESRLEIRRNESDILYVVCPDCKCDIRLTVANGQIIDTSKG